MSNDSYHLRCSQNLAFVCGKQYFMGVNQDSFGGTLLIFTFSFLIACGEVPKTSIPEPEDQGTPLDTGDTAEPTDTGDSGVVEEVDPDEEGREGQVICSSGGSVSSSNFSGSFCFGAVDLSSSPTATSANYTWHAGPMTKVSP